MFLQDFNKRHNKVNDLLRVKMFGLLFARLIMKVLNMELTLERFNEAWEKTKVTWYPIPIGIGIAFIAFQHMLRVYAREKRKEQDTSTESRPVIVGPWQVI